MSVKRLRIFLSSPGDVEPERRRAALLIQRLKADYATHFALEPYLWEHEVMLASGHFQDNIDPPSEADIVVLIVWTRLGTPMPERTAKREYRGIDGRSPVTGTEWEFEDALAANRKAGGAGPPDLLVYRKMADPSVSLRDKEKKAAVERQWDALEGFWQRHFADGGSFKTASNAFETLDAFERKLEADLRTLIEGRIRARVNEAATGDLWLRGNPYRGLAAYDAASAEIFFGRARATRDGVERLIEAAAKDCAFLLVVGASGLGKSSLVKAGIIPAINLPGVAPGIGAWRIAELRPGGHGGDLAAALATALAGALPELLAPGQDAAALSRHLATDTDPGFLVQAALWRAAAAERLAGHLAVHERIRLLLFVDQLEELYTDAEITPERRAAFARALNALARSGEAAVIVTLRNDFWGRIVELPEMAALAEAGEELRLLPPDHAEIAEIVRRPAETAGVRFESDPASQIALHAVIAQEAAAEPGALPLVSFLMEALFRTDVEEKRGGVLSFATYRSLGGLMGAIGKRADDVIAALGDSGPAAFAKLMRSLVQTRPGEPPTARMASVSKLSDDPVVAALFAAMLARDARLLVADGDTLRIAHEALLLRWPTAKQWVDDNRRDIETRARIEDSFALWKSAAYAQKSKRLLTGLSLLDAEDLNRRWGRDLDPELTQFVNASSKVAASQRRRRRQLTIALFAILSLTTLASLTGLYVAQLARLKTSLSQSQFLAQQSVAATQRGEGPLGLALALSALPNDLDAPNRPITVEAVAALSNAWVESWIPNSFKHERAVRSAKISPDGSQLLTTSDQVYIWDIASHVILKSKTFEDLEEAYFLSSNRILVRTNKLDESGLYSPFSIWDTSTDSVSTAHEMLENSTFNVIFQTSRSGKYIATSKSFDSGPYQMWNLQNPALAPVTIPESDFAIKVFFYPVSQKIALVYSKGVIVRSLPSLDLLQAIPFQFPVQSVAITPQEDAIAVAFSSPPYLSVLPLSRDGSIELKDRIVDIKYAIDDIEFFSRNNLIFLSPKLGVIRISDPDDKDQVFTLGDGIQTTLSHDISFAGDRYIATSDILNPTINVWHMSEPILHRVEARFRAHTDTVFGVWGDEHGNAFSSASRDGYAKIWAGGNGSEITHLGRADQIALHEQKLLAGLENEVAIIEYNAGAQATSRKIEGSVLDVFFDKSTPKAIISNARGDVSLLDMTNGNTKLVAESVSASSAKVFGQNNDRVVMTYLHSENLVDSEAAIFSISGQKIADLKRSSEVMKGDYTFILDTSPSGDLVSVTGSKFVGIWTAQGEFLCEVAEPLGEVTNTYLSPDHRYILAHGFDDKIRLISSEDCTEEEVNLRFDHRNLELVSWASDSKSFLAASERMILEYNLDSRASRVIFKTDHDISGLHWDDGQGTVYLSIGDVTELRKFPSMDLLGRYNTVEWTNKYRVLEKPLVVAGDGGSFVVRTSEMTFLLRAPPSCRKLVEWAHEAIVQSKFDLSASERATYFIEDAENEVIPGISMVQRAFGLYDFDPNGVCRN